MAGAVYRTSYSLLVKLSSSASLHIKSTRTIHKKFHQYQLIALRKMSSVASPTPLAVPAIQEQEQEDQEVVEEEINKTELFDQLPNATSSPAPSPATDAPQIEDPIPKFERIKKRKVALLLSYCGQGYYGMQKNPDTDTIELALFNAMLKHDYIDKLCFDKPQNFNYQRCARTDKNVSAARQVVSFKAPETFDISKVNGDLPPCIRVMGIKRVTKGFDAKNSCDARTYSYMLPSFAFAPLETIVTDSYRISPEVLEEVRDVFSNYTGTKNYHNFTSRKRPADPSAKRHMLSFTVSDPWEEDGIEYLLLRVKGQSFMLHQIRKMIGLATAICRGFTDKSIFTKAFSTLRIDIPRAPGVGLMLEEVHFPRYDQRYGSDGMHEPITWDNEKEKIEKFCKEYIYPIITKAEKEEHSMMMWLGTLSYHSYDVREHDNECMSSRIGDAKIRVRIENGERVDDEDEDDDDDDDEEGKKNKRPRNAKRFKKSDEGEAW